MTGISPTDAAWAAGFLDGDGWLGVRGGYSPAVQAAQTGDRAALDKLQQLFGGVVNHKGGAKHVWTMGGGKAVRAFLLVTLPYFVQKRREAEALALVAMAVNPRGAGAYEAIEQIVRDRAVAGMATAKAARRAGA